MFRELFLILKEKYEMILKLKEEKDFWMIFIL